MADRPGRAACWAALAASLATLGTAGAQDPPKAAPAKAAPAKKAGLRAAGGAPPKARRPVAPDPLAETAPEWPFQYKMKIAGADGHPMAAWYYPSKLGANAPVLILVHERGPGRSAKDFQAPIDDLKGANLAEYLQEQEYAVLLLDLRGQGQNPRRELSAREFAASAQDLQSAYLFLVDRHNRRELNLGKLGVIALGDGANLAAAWAASPGAATSGEGRISDLNALAMISPVEDAQGIRLAPLAATLAPRMPIFLAAGKRGNEAVKAAQPAVERQRLSKVVSFDTNLRGERLLNFVAGVPQALVKFLDDPVKFRNVEWEPRWLLTPVGYSLIQVVNKTNPEAAEPEAGVVPSTPAAKKGAARKKGEAVPK